MSRFEADLRRAQARQHRLYLFGFVLLVVAVLAVGGGVIFANGTAITIAPDDAAVTGSVAVTEGPAIAVAGIVYGLSATPRVRVESAGFYPLERALLPEERGRRITVTLQPLPGTIVATTEPLRDDTDWSIDGRPVATGAALEGEVEAGMHTLSADSRWHPPVSQEVTVGRGETVTMTVELPALDGRLAIASEPPGAAVTIDGEAAGETPVERAVPGGRYAVAVTRDGFEPIEDVIDITRDAPVAERRYRLQPVSATLSVNVSPAGGELLLDGRRIEPGRDHDVASGRDLTLTYVRPGWRGARETVRLAPGERREVTLRLAADTGTIEIVSEPAATIFVDGREAGEGRATLTLPTVAHRIELKKPGYRTVTRTVTPRRGSAVVIRATLQTELQARLAEAPKRYTNSAGIEMLLFEPTGAFTIGAPRSQPGQRANEFERRIVLNKRFYASLHEVTNAQYRRFDGARRGGDTLPVTGIAWRDAAAFCNWLSVQEKLTPFYRIAASQPVRSDPQADGYRLLSEAEWEWLARSAGRPQQTVFTWGDETLIPKGAGNIADESANGLTRYYVPNYNDGHARLAPVGSYPAEASGLHDLTGNASEWVHDYYGLTPPRAGETFADPLGPPVGEGHVVKGSSWQSGTRTTLRAAFRDGLEGTRDDVGFRIGRYLYGAE